MHRNFKIGDTVILIRGEGIHDLEFNKSYTVVETSSILSHQTIAFEGTGNMTNYSHPYPNIMEYHFYNSNRFISDVKILRK